MGGEGERLKFIKLKGVREGNKKGGELKLHCNLTIEVLLIEEYLVEVTILLFSFYNIIDFTITTLRNFLIILFFLEIV